MCFLFLPPHDHPCTAGRTRTSRKRSVVTLGYTLQDKIQIYRKKTNKFTGGCLKSILFIPSSFHLFILFPSSLHPFILLPSFLHPSSFDPCSLISSSLILTVTPPSSFPHPYMHPSIPSLPPSPSLLQFDSYLSNVSSSLINCYLVIVQLCSSRICNWCCIWPCIYINTNPSQLVRIPEKETWVAPLGPRQCENNRSD